MKAASVQEIKEALNHLSSGQIAELCLRLVKFKKDNKEIVSYLLFDAHHPDGYIEEVKKEMQLEFEEINSSNLYFAKKGLRRILRDTNKQIRYIASKPAEIELLLTYCRYLKASGIPFRQSQALDNLYQSQLKKIRKLMSTMHEDLQYDIERELGKLSK